MSQTPSTPLEHIRGTTMHFVGWVRRGSQAKTDLPSDTLYFMIADPVTMVPIISRQSGASGVTQDATGQWSVTLEANLSKRASLPKDRYWVQVDLKDATTGNEWCVARGPLELLPSPRG